MARSKGEEAYIDQKTRQLMVVWSDHCIRFDTLPDIKGTDIHDPANLMTISTARDLGMHKVYVDHALHKGWLTKKTPRSPTSTGWKTAAAFLRR